MKDDTKSTVSTTSETVATLPNYQSAALAAFDAGFTPIPVLPGTKRTAVKWNRWSKKLSRRNISRYWKKHPNHEVGILLNDALIVYDADTPEGVEALYELEKSLNITPNLIVTTNRGEHHYFRRAKGTKAKSDAPDKTDHPERVDVKTGKALIIIPPSTGKRPLVNEIKNVNDLVEIDQSVIDAFQRHNGRTPAADKPERVKAPPSTSYDSATSELQSLLLHLDPDMGYTDWVKVLMVAFYCSGGTEEGLKLAMSWSSKGRKFKGPGEIIGKWESFDIDHPDPVTVSTLYTLVKETLGEEKYRQIESSLGPQWDTSRGDTIIHQVAAPTQNIREHPLVKLSLQGQSAELKKEFANHELILGRLVIRGQWVVFYARPNTGKTLLLLSLIIQGIKAGVIDPQHVFYVNADDGGPGMATKAAIADKHGFHMLVPGYHGFKSQDLLSLLIQVAEAGYAPKAIIILDVLKKFTDLMNKSELRKFGNAIREFCAQGGTVVGLAHTNKKRDDRDKLVYSGTTDIVEDADCVYMIDVLTEADDLRIIELENTKKRGDVARKAAYQYCTAEGQSYKQLVKSVKEVDPDNLDHLRQDAELETSGDKTLIELVKGYIAQGINTKTALIDKLALQDDVSKRRAREVIEKYTGTDPIRHYWNFKVGKKGTKTFSILKMSSPDPAPAPDKEAVTR